MWAVPQLFLGAQEVGPVRCYFCGGSCEDAIPIEGFLRPSFTGMDTTGMGTHVCNGCVSSQVGFRAIELADGTFRHDQKVRSYSWLLSPSRRLAVVPSMRSVVLDWMLDPPETPFAIVVSTSGQKHLLYRSSVNYVTSDYWVTFETEKIRVVRSMVEDRMDLVKSVCAVVGRAALAEDVAGRSGMELYGAIGDRALANWMAVKSQPLTRLLVWICPRKEECLNSLS